jgi:hypothetical protein
MKKYKLGEKIIVNHKLVRDKIDKYRNWTIVLLAPKEVTVVGVRVLWDGKMDIGEDGGYFVSTKSKRALLVAENLKSTFYVLAE